jgi:hypothetical protein
MGRGPASAVAEGFTQLVAHVLAHVALDQPGNLHDPRYRDWARAHTPAADVELLEHDAALLARCWVADARLDLLHGFAELHAGLDGFRRAASRSLAQLEDAEVRAPGLLAELRGVPAAELLHATCALVEGGFAVALTEVAAELARGLEQIAPLLGRLAAVVPGFDAARVELVWALGLHGRAFGDRILVGAPGGWSGCEPDRQAVLAAHEHAVDRSSRGDYLGREWDALTGLARWLRDGDDELLRAAHGQWLAQLELDGFVAGAGARGWLTPVQAERILERPSARAAELAQLAESS